MSLFSSVKFSQDIPTHVRELLESAADYSKKEQWEIALTLSTNALEELENVLASNSRDVGLVLSIIASINTKVDKYDEAEMLWKRAISILEKYDEDTNVVLIILWKLVRLFASNRRYKEAVHLSKQAVEIYQDLPTIDLLQLYRQKLVIGGFLLHLKKPDEAKMYFCAALPFYAEKFGSYSTQVTEIFASLEIAYFWRNNIAESKESFKNSNEIADAFQLCSLGMLCEDGSFTLRAIGYYERAVKIYESKGFLDDLQLADINLRLGKCYLRTGNYTISGNYLSKSRDIYEKTLADDDPVLLDIKFYLAYGYVQSARFYEAKSIYKEILGNTYTDGSGMSILEWAWNNERNGEDRVPNLNGQCNFIVPVLMNLSALYILEGEYKAAKTLQNFVDYQHDLIEDDGN